MSDDSRPQIELLRGSPTPEELAALVAVLSDAYDTEVAAASLTPRRRTRWELSARTMRGSLDRDAGWGGFSG